MIIELTACELDEIRAAQRVERAVKALPAPQRILSKPLLPEPKQPRTYRQNIDLRAANRVAGVRADGKPRQNRSWPQYDHLDHRGREYHTAMMREWRKLKVIAKQGEKQTCEPKP